MPSMKWCFVPTCRNTTFKTPGKIFLTVPQSYKRKQKWFSAVGRDIKGVSLKSSFYCCEDHFNLEEDMENYYEYKYSKVAARMKSDVVPHIFIESGKMIVMMPSLDHCMNNQSGMTTLTKTLEVFDTYKHRDDKDSDEESFHLPLDDDESDTKIPEPARNGNGVETEDDILNKFENNPAGTDAIDSQLEERLLNDDDEKKAPAEKIEEVPAAAQEVQNVDPLDEDNKDEEKSANEEAVVETEKSVEPDVITADEKKETEVSVEKTEESDVAEKSDVATEDKEKLSEAEQESGAIDAKVESKPEESEPSKETPVQDEETQKPTVNEDQKDDPSSQENSSNDEKSTEKSDDFPKHNEDSEDLFDISIIRDAEEDNADAYKEAQADAKQMAEQEELERTEDKMEEDAKEEEDEEMDIDKQEDQLKSDDVDIEEDNLKMDCDANKDVVSDGDSENSNKSAPVQINNEQSVSESTDSEEKSDSQCRLDEVTGNLVDDEGAVVCEESTLETVANNEESSKSSLKRPLSEENSEAAPTKKSRTDKAEGVQVKETEKPKEKLPLKTLLTLSDFMKTRKHNKRLTMHDLEEFCVQKICEAIVHKSELGDVHHQLKQQEQLIEAMRKEIQQLTKQARDLEIVNKKLMNDLKQQSTTQKPLSPLKITRSVGLQVKFTPTFETNLKRRPNTTGSQKVAQSAQNRGARTTSGSVTPTVVRQVATPQKQQVLPKPNTPLLSQALQNRRIGTTDSSKTPNQGARTKTVDPKTSSPAASVIDLTDEDDKREKNKTSPTKLVSPKNITVPLRTTPMRVNATAQGIRLTTSQGKISPITSMVNSSTPQVMYVVQSSTQNVLTSSLGAPKTVVVNFQSNGVLTSALNGSAVSVIPKQGNTIQLKAVTPTKPVQNNKIVKPANKHPAPLPTPPVVRVASDKPLKPIPPKPHLTIRKTETGIILQWKMPYELEMYEVIASYQLYAYQETSALPSTDMWRKVGDVKALALPMACTLTQFADKNKYYFAVRPVDIHKRIGMFSEPEEISL